jgi:hypothetical protein
MEYPLSKQALLRLWAALVLLFTGVVSVVGTQSVSATTTCGPTQPRTVLGVPFNNITEVNRNNSGQIYSGPINYAETPYNMVRAGQGSLQAYTFAGLPDNLPYFSVGQAYAYDPYDLGDIFQVWQSNLEFDTSHIEPWRVITNTYLELDYSYDWSPNAFYVEARPTSYTSHNASAWVPGASITTSAPAAFTKFGHTVGCSIRLIGDLTPHINRGGITQLNLTPAGFAANVPPVSGDGVLGFTGARLVVEYSISDFFP